MDLLGGLQNAIGGYLPGQMYNTIKDSRTDREKLGDKLNKNNDSIKTLQKENEEIKEAIQLLDEHPILEKMNNLIKRLIG